MSDRDMVELDCQECGSLIGYANKKQKEVVCESCFYSPIEEEDEDNEIEEEE